MAALIRSRSVFGGAFGLNLIGVKHAIGPIRSFDERLCVVLEGVWRGLHTAIRDLKLQSLFIDLEIRSGSLMTDAAGDNLSRYAKPFGMCVRAHPLEFLDGDVIALRISYAGKRKIGERANDYGDGDAKT